MRAVMIDDNEIDRLNLRTLLADYPDVAIAGEAATLESALGLIEREHPDLVFLDIHLGRQKGFGVLERLSYKPLVIITTSHPHYALKGFEIEAVDFLLKPIMESGLARALHRFPQLAPALLQLPARLDPLDIQMFKSSDGLDVIPVSHILAITGERIYSRVLVQGGRDYLHNRSLHGWKELLPEKQFQMLDRSTLVSIREIKSVSSEGVISFRNSKGVVTVGETAMKALREML